VTLSDDEYVVGMLFIDQVPYVLLLSISKITVYSVGGGCVNVYGKM